MYGIDLDEGGIEEFIANMRQPRYPILSSEDLVISSVGRDLCEKFYRGYTKKQWGLDLSELDAGVAARIPTRINDDDRYFSDVFQYMPLHGYTSMFNKMLASKLIEIRLSVEFTEIRDQIDYDRLVFTGPIDAYYDYRFGKLAYRSIRFEHKHFQKTESLQPVGTLNFPNEFEYTRISEFKHLTGQIHSGSSIVREYPTSEGDPFYPIPRFENHAMFKKYEALSSSEEKVTFIGRLAHYRYYNMDQVVASALACFERLKT